MLNERADTSGTVDFMRSPQTYPLIVGTQPDTYRAFMARTWANIGHNGTIGLVHPDTHFSGEREAHIRENAYRRLRVHGDFVNAMHRFFPEPVAEVTHFGVHIYGRPKDIGFAHLSWLTEAPELSRSLTLAEDGKVPEGWDRRSGAPGVRYKGGWDSRRHPARVIQVNLDMLTGASF